MDIGIAIGNARPLSICSSYLVKMLIVSSKITRYDEHLLSAGQTDRWLPLSIAYACPMQSLSRPGEGPTSDGLLLATKKIGRQIVESSTKPQVTLGQDYKTRALPTDFLVGNARVRGSRRSRLRCWRTFFSPRCPWVTEFASLTASAPRFACEIGRQQAAERPLSHADGGAIAATRGTKSMAARTCGSSRSRGRPPGQPGRG